MYIETDKWASVVGNSKKHAHIQLTVVGKSPSVSTLHSNSKLEGVLRTLTPRRALDVVREVGAWIWIRDREQGYQLISAEQQSHTEEYGVVHGSSNHTRKNTKEYGVLHVERNKK